MLRKLCAATLLFGLLCGQTLAGPNWAVIEKARSAKQSSAMECLASSAAPATSPSMAQATR